MAVEGLHEKCPLCDSCSTVYFWQDRLRHYYRCLICELIFVPKSWQLPSCEEKKHYDAHQNSPDDQQYRLFLSRLFLPVLKQLDEESLGLDFGCGPGPTLSLMFEEAGHKMSLYDRYYYQDEKVLQQRYDFITASEVVEHLSSPGVVLSRLWQQIKLGGWLGLMTKRVTSLKAFEKWHYKNDPTHICFFGEESFKWLGHLLNTAPMFEGPDVVIFQKLTR